MKVYKIRHYGIICCLAVSVIFLTAAGVICRRSSKPSGPKIFEKYVIKPISESVMDIKVDKLTPGGLFDSGHKYVMRFKISEVDIRLILKSRAFEEFEIAAYSRGTRWDNLEWSNPSSNGKRQSIIVYARPQRPPEWFKPDDWNGSKVYSFREKWGRSRRYRTQVLIFNEELAQAYFFEDVPGH